MNDIVLHRGNLEARGLIERYLDGDNSSVFPIPVTEASLSRPKQVFEPGHDLHYDGRFIVPQKLNEELSDETDISVILKYEDHMREHFQTVNNNPIKQGA